MALEAYFMHLAVLIGIYIILAVSLNLAMGYTGLLNIGHVAFFAVGAYASTLLTLKLGLSFWIAIILAGLFASVAGLLLALPTLRLKGDYFAIATLGFAYVLEYILKNWMSLTNGPLGLPGIPKPEIFGITITGFSYLMLVMLIATLTCIFIWHITRTPFGRILKAIREDEIVISSLGKNIVKYKTEALIISAFFAGIAGSLYAHYITFIDPTGFTILEAVLIISMVIVGGMGSVPGSIVGAIVITLLPEPLRFLPLPSFAIGALRQMMYAGLLILLLIKRPQGLLGERTSRDDD